MDSRNLVSYNSKQIVWNYSKATQAYTKEISELEIIAKLWCLPETFPFTSETSTTITAQNQF